MPKKYNLLHMPLEEVYRLVHTMPQAEYDAWWPTVTSDEVRRYAESVPPEKRMPPIMLQEQSTVSMNEQSTSISPTPQDGRLSLQIGEQRAAVLFTPQGATLSLGEQSPAPANNGHRKKKRAKLPPGEKPVVTVDEAADEIGCSGSWLYEHDLTGDDLHPERIDGLKSFMHAGKRKVLRKDLDDYLRRRGGSNGTTEAE